MADDPHARRGDYRSARIGAAAAFVACIVLIVLVDAVNADYEASIGVLGLLAGMTLTLLGLEAKAILGRDP